MSDEITAPKFHITVDVVVFTLRQAKLELLLISRADKPYQGVRALPGGFLQAKETSLQAAQRILHDKAGVSDVYTEQLYTFDNFGRDVRGHFPSITYYALVPEHKLNIESSGTTQQPQLFAVSDLPRLAFDHAKIIAYALGRLRAKLEYTNLAFSLLPTEFTLNQLQKTYEAVLDRPLDKRNFRKKFMSLGIIQATGAKTTGQRYRPAQLYSFTSHEPTELARWF